MVMYNNRIVEGRLIEQPVGLHDYEIRVHTDIFGELTAHRDNVREW